MNLSDLHAKYLVDCVGAALHHKELPVPKFELNPSYFVQLACAHHLSGLLYPLFSKSGDRLGADALKAFSQDFKRDQMRDITQEDALEELSERFQAENIRFMVLKGVVLKRYYEKSYQRMMGDIDLLIDESDRARAKEIMESLGYETQSYEVLYDDVYYRRPFLNVEIHIALGKEADFSDPIFSSVWERARQDTTYSVRYEMSDEDYYLYFIHHAAKHCKGHGTGIRTLVDFWFIERKLLPHLDRVYLDEKLASFGSLRFETEFSALCKAWFDSAPMDEFQGEPMRRFLILEAGLYGNFSNAIFKQTVEHSDTERSHAKKRGLFLRRVFLPRKQMSVRYPILKKHAWPLPFLWFWRILRTLFTPKNVRNEVKLYSTISKGMDFQTQMRMRFGFTQESDSADGGAE